MRFIPNVIGRKNTCEVRYTGGAYVALTDGSFIILMTLARIAIAALACSLQAGDKLARIYGQEVGFPFQKGSCENHTPFPPEYLNSTTSYSTG